MLNGKPLPQTLRRHKEAAPNSAYKRTSPHHPAACSIHVKLKSNGSTACDWRRQNGKVRAGCRWMARASDA